MAQKWAETFAQRLTEASPDPLVIALDLFKEAGARNSKTDLANIQAMHDHAVALGATCSTKEAANDLKDIVLVESAVAFPSDYTFTESSAVNPVVKIIDAGRGSTGYYTKEVLQRDGPEIFKAGTLMYINHATAAEEAARPEGDWTRLMGVTVGNAYWDEHGKEGAALYAPSKVFSDYAAQVKEKAPYTGVSIRAGGRINERKIAPDGKPGVIEALTRAASIDVVTKAGRGGKLILEAQQAINLFEAAQGDIDMDEAQVQRLVEAAVTKATAPLLAKIAEQEKPKVKRGKTINALLEGIHFPAPVYKDLVIERVKANYPLTEAGATDATRLKALVEKELGKISEQLSRESGMVVNLGPAPTADPKFREGLEKQYDAEFSESMNDLADVFLDHNEETNADALKRRRNLFTNGRAA